MSNNIYDIMKKLNAVESIDKPTQEPTNATLLESTMDQVLSEKYMGFDKVVASAKKGGARDPEAVAASIGRKKYGEEKFQKAAAAGKKLGEDKKVEADDMDEGNKFTGNLAKARAKGLKKADLDGDGDMETVKEEKKETKSGTIHKAKPGRYGGYNPETDPDKDDDEKKSEPAVKRGRGRPKKGADSDTGEVKKWDTDTLQRWIVGSKPKTLPGKASVKHKMKDESVEQGVAEGRLDELGNTPAGRTALRAVQKRGDDEITAWNKKPESGFSAAPDSAKKHFSASIAAGNRLHGFRPDALKKNTVLARDALRRHQKGEPITPEEVEIIRKWYPGFKIDEGQQGVAEGRSPIPPNFPRSLAKKIYEHYNGDVNSTLITMWNIHNTVMENVAPSKKKINESMSFEQATTKPANKPVVGTYKGGVWTADPPKKGEVGVPVPQNIDGGSATPSPKQQSPKKTNTTTMGSIKGGVWTADPPKPGQPGVPAPQDIDGGSATPSPKKPAQKKAEVNTDADTGLAEMLNLAGIKNSISETEIVECGMSPISGQYMNDTEGRMSINTNMSTDGNKSVTITADGDSAVELMKMLKMAGLHADGSEDTDIEKMSEEKDDRYEANTTPEEEVLPIQTQLKGGDGEVAGKEKKMTPHGYQFADNPIAMKESMTLKLMKEYESIKKVK